MRVPDRDNCDRGCVMANYNMCESYLYARQELAMNVIYHMHHTVGLLKYF